MLSPQLSLRGKVVPPAYKKGDTVSLTVEGVFVLILRGKDGSFLRRVRRFLHATTEIQWPVNRFDLLIPELSKDGALLPPTVSNDQVVITYRLKASRAELFRPTWSEEEIFNYMPITPFRDCPSEFCPVCANRESEPPLYNDRRIASTTIPVMSGQVFAQLKRDSSVLVLGDILRAELVIAFFPHESTVDASQAPLTRQISKMIFTFEEDFVVVEQQARQYIQYICKEVLVTDEIHICDAVTTRTINMGRITTPPDFHFSGVSCSHILRARIFLKDPEETVLTIHRISVIAGDGPCPKAIVEGRTDRSVLRHARRTEEIDEGITTLA